jgi:hypothetical protein
MSPERVSALIKSILTVVSPDMREAAEEDMLTIYELGKQEGKREGMTEAAGVCDGYKLQAVEDSNDVAHNYACKECAQAIIAKRDELAGETGDKSKEVAR